MRCFCLKRLVCILQTKRKRGSYGAGDMPAPATADATAGNGETEPSCHAAPCPPAAPAAAKTQRPPGHMRRASVLADDSRPSALSASVSGIAARQAARSHLPRSDCSSRSANQQGSLRGRSGMGAVRWGGWLMRTSESNCERQAYPNTHKDCSRVGTYQVGGGRNNTNCGPAGLGGAEARVGWFPEGCP